MGGGRGGGDTHKTMMNWRLEQDEMSSAGVPVTRVFVGNGSGRRMTLVVHLLPLPLLPKERIPEHARGFPGDYGNCFRFDRAIVVSSERRRGGSTQATAAPDKAEIKLQYPPCAPPINSRWIRLGKGGGEDYDVREIVGKRG